MGLSFTHILITGLVVFLILGGPLTLYALVKLTNEWLGGVKGRFVRIKGDSNLGFLVEWDNVSFEHAIQRVRFDLFELVRGGRSASFSYTFEDKSAKKKSFVIPLTLTESDRALLTDNGLPGLEKRSLNKSYAHVEIETVNGDCFRLKIPKRDIVAVLRSVPFMANSEVEILQAIQPDTWSLLTKVFPWKKAVAASAAAPAAAKGAKPAAAAKSAGPRLVDFIVTKVWIEPGCIVCDACENEAPEVFQVLADTCIVRENAPLADGASIQAAAEGCPVDVIKYTTVPKSA
jgi:ferredoxin